MAKLTQGSSVSPCKSVQHCLTTLLLHFDDKKNFHLDQYNTIPMINAK